MAMKQGNLPAIVPEVFNHEQFGQFRYIKRDEEIWFVAVDVCRALDIKNPSDVVAKQLDDDEKSSVILSTNGVTNTLDNIYGSSDAKKGWIENRVNIVSEPGLYHLIFISRKPEAKKFRRWVFHEVLPSIRKYGFYGLLSGEKALQLTDKEYLRYLGGLDCFQYDAYLDQLTGEQRLEHYSRLEERIDRKDLTQEEILSLGNDPYIIVSRIGHGPWKASY